MSKRIEVKNNKWRFMDTAERIQKYCAEIYRFLVEKNESYGDSALNPDAVFGTSTPVQALHARINDKLARIKHAPESYGEDTVKDLIGYLIFLQLAKEDEANKAE